MTEPCPHCGAVPDLLGLPLKHQFLKDAEQAFRSSMLGVIFIDLDGFKAVNDIRGHEAGDRCLVDVVSIIGRVGGEAGRLYRCGGDEFAVLVEQADTESVAGIADSIRAAIDTGPPGRGYPRVTASIGVACQAKVNAADARTLISEADYAVYVSKFVGEKNCVTVAPVAESDRVFVDGRRQADTFTTAFRALMLAVHENSEALRQICDHTDRLHDMWIRSATAHAALQAFGAIVDARDAVYGDVVAILSTMVEPQLCAQNGGEYNHANPVYHARRYVGRAVSKFVKHPLFKMLANSIGLFAMFNSSASLYTEAELLRHAHSRESAGSNPSLSNFLDTLLRVEKIASEVSGLSAKLLPDLRSVASTVTMSETK